MPEEERFNKSEAIFRRLVSLPAFLNAGCLYCYVDAFGEVGSRKIITEARRLGKRVAAPVVKDREMEFGYIGSLDELRPGKYGILEPVFYERAEEPGLVIMPGVAFDDELHRIGYGGGYYDRYLEGRREFPVIALAFEWQVLASIPYESHDVCPDILITEERIRRRKP